MEKQLARWDTKLEAAEKENADLHSKNTELDSKNDDLTTEVLERSKSELPSPPPLAKTASSTNEITKS
jgi:hypothetical protein